MLHEKSGVSELKTLNLFIHHHHEKTALPEAFPAGLFFLESEKVSR